MYVDKGLFKVVVPALPADMCAAQNGARKPGSLELTGWREWVANIAPVMQNTNEVNA